MKTITIKFLQKHGACGSGMRYVKNEFQFPTPLDKMINHSIKINEKEKLQWANWLIVRCMNEKQKVQYSIFAAEKVIKFYEKKYPDDDRPRKAIEAAKKYLKNPCEKTKNTAAYAADAAADAYTTAADAYTTYAAASAAYAAASAASYTAAAAAAYAAAASAASYTADAAASAASYIAYNKLLIKILKYGLKLLE